MKARADLAVVRIDAGSRLWTLASAALALLPLLLQLPLGLAMGIALAAVLVTALSWRKRILSDDGRQFFRNIVSAI